LAFCGDQYSAVLGSFQTMKSLIPHWATVLATSAAQPQNAAGLCTRPGRAYSASTTCTPSFCACGAARWMNGSSSIPAGLAGS